MTMKLSDSKQFKKFTRGLTDYLLYDDFGGPVSALGGRVPPIAPNGGAWVASGAASALIVAGGNSLTQSSNAANPGYAIFELGEIPGEIGCEFIAADGTTTPTLASYQTSFISNMLHLYMGAANMNWTYWLSGTTMIAPAFTSSAPDFVLTPGAPYTYRCITEPPYAHGFVHDADGAPVGYVLIYDPNMASVIGTTAFWETFNDSLRYTKVWARRRKVATEEVGRIKTGISDTPIGLEGRAYGLFSGAHVGFGVPAGALSVRYDGNAAYRPTVRSTGHAEFEVRSETSGSVARVLLTNGAGGQGGIRMGGSFEFAAWGHDGSDFLIKPANQGAPYFAAGFRTNGSSSPLETSGAAAPTSGTYAQGDHCRNSSPSVGQPKGWICTVGGSPGTWVSEGNL